MVGEEFTEAIEGDLLIGSAGAIRPRKIGSVVSAYPRTAVC